MDENRSPYADAPPKKESLSELVGQLARNTATLVHDEIELLIKRGQEAASAIGSGIILSALGVFLLLGAFLSLCAALIIWLTQYTSAELAAAATGGTLAILGLILGLTGYSRLKKSLHKP